MTSLTMAISRQLPTLFLIGILANYAINAVLVLGFLAPILLPTFGVGAYWIAGAGAFTFQFFRAIIVGQGLLHPNDDGTVPGLVQFVALASTIIATVELYFALGHAELGANGFWAVFVFSLTLIWGGFTAEIMFISSAHKSISSGESVSHDDDDDKIDNVSERPVKGSERQNGRPPYPSPFPLGLDDPENPSGKN